MATSAAETAACVASICPLPRKIAAEVASATTSASWAVPVPIWSTSRSATAIPSATPSATSAARCPRWPTVMPSVMIADTGAKNGVGWPSTSVAISHASAADTDAWKIERHASRSRSTRVRHETRERSAASSISGAARSESVGASAGRAAEHGA